MKRNLNGRLGAAGLVILILTFMVTVFLAAGCEDLVNMFSEEEETTHSWVEDLPPLEKGSHRVYFLTSHISGLAAANPSYKDVRSPDNKVDALAAEPARSGYTFIGWYNNPAETGGTKFTADTVVTGDWKLYGRWLYGTPTTVTFNGNGGTPPTQTRTVTPPEATVLDWPEDPVKPGPDSFSGWYKGTNGGEMFLPSSVVPYSTSITIYAQYGDMFTVTFDRNGGETGANPETMSIFGSGTLGALPLPPARSGYAFGGWFDTSAETGGTPFTDSTTISGDKTVYARWVPPKVVTFNANGGIPESQTKEVVEGAALGSLPSTPVRKGYRFKGWFSTSADTGGSQITVATVVNNDMEVFARWGPLLQYLYQAGYSTGNTQIKDESEGGNNAVKSGTVTVGRATISGTYHYSAYVANTDGYFDMGAGVGKIIKDLTEEFSVMSYYHLNSSATTTGNGRMFFSFSMSNNLGSNIVPGMFMSLKQDRQGWTTFSQSWNDEQKVEINNSISPEKNAWHHIAYVQSGRTGPNNGKLYVDGALVKESTVTMLPGDAGETPYNYFSRPPYSGDNYLRYVRYHDFRLYGKALSASEISTLANRRTSLPTSWTTVTAP